VNQKIDRKIKKAKTKLCFAAQTPKLRKVAPQKKDTKNTDTDTHTQREREREREREKLVAASPALKCKQAKLAVRRSALPRYTKDVVRKYPQIVDDDDDDKTFFFFYDNTPPFADSSHH